MGVTIAETDGLFFNAIAASASSLTFLSSSFFRSISAAFALALALTSREALDEEREKM